MMQAYSWVSTLTVLVLFLLSGVLLVAVILLRRDLTRRKHHNQKLEIALDECARKIDQLKEMIIERDSALARQTEINLRQTQDALNRQQLLTEISNSFITGSNVDGLIASAMDMTSMIVTCDDISLALYDRTAGRLEERVSWHDDAKGASGRPDYQSQMAPGNPYYDSFIKKHLSYAKLQGGENGTVTALVMPLRIGDELLGVLRFARATTHEEWDEGTVHLANTLSSILSGVITRDRLTRELTRMSAIVKHSPDLIAFYQRDQAVHYFNPAYERVTGYTLAELNADGGRCLHSEEDMELLYQKMVPEALAQGVSSADVKVMRKNGEQLIMFYTMFPVKDGDWEGLASIAVDVTEQRKLAAALVEAKEEAERSSHAKSAFLSNMSHEIRTPMNAIMGMTTIARKSEDMDAVKDCLNKIAVSSSHLLDVINNILDMSKIEAEKLVLSPSPFSLRQQLKNVFTIVNVRAQEKGQTVSFEVPDDVPDRYYADPLRFTQIMTNLLYNAVKFSGNDTPVRLGVKLLVKSQDVAKLRFDVTDQGIGMTGEQLSRLFTPFEQADGGVSRKYGGTGLGLALTKNIVKLFGGQLTVNSIPGQGSTFTVMLEMQLDQGAPQQQEEELSSLDMRGKRLLVVDDVEINRSIVMALLEDTGIALEGAADGLAATEMVRKDPDRYDMVLMDVQMPVMDGYTATGIIRQLNPGLPVVAMTANAFQEDVDKAKKSGMVDHIAKPLDVKKLLRVMKRYIVV